MPRPPKNKTPRLTPEFRKLQTEWYKKLEASGFDDIEHTASDGGENNWLKKYSMVTRANDPRRPGTLAHEKQRYFELARQFLHATELTPWEHFLWHSHSEGLGPVSILRQVTTRKKISQTLKGLKARFMDWVSRYNDEVDDE